MRLAQLHTTASQVLVGDRLFYASTNGRNPVFVPVIRVDLIGGYVRIWHSSGDTSRRSPRDMVLVERSRQAVYGSEK